MKTNITVDTDTIRRLHSIAKELASLIESWSHRHASFRGAAWVFRAGGRVPPWRHCRTRSRAPSPVCSRSSSTSLLTS